MLMVAFLLKDLISGMKIVILSGKKRQKRASRIRFFFGGLCLCCITMYVLYASTIYNLAIAEKDTEVIYNAVIILFIMEIDESVFGVIDVINKRWIDKFKKDKSDNDSDSVKSQAEWLAKTQELERKLDELQNKMQLLEQRCGLLPLDTDEEQPLDTDKEQPLDTDEE